MLQRSAPLCIGSADLKRPVAPFRLQSRQDLVPGASRQKERDHGTLKLKLLLEAMLGAPIVASFAPSSDARSP